ncbi:MAG: IS630 family transposase [Gemmatimonadales bacterium]
MTGISIRSTTETRKQLEATLRQAFKAGDVALVKRVTALLGIARGEAVELVAAGVGMGRATVYGWLRTFLLEGVPGLRVQWKGGRPPKLTPTQRQRLAELVTAGPEAAGFPTGCWHALLIQQVIAREFGVAYNVQYLATLLHTLGFSFQKARFVSDHLDALARAAWLAYTWPAWRARAAAAGGLLLFGDEASFAQWGSLGYTWAPIGQQPVVKTTGKRKAYKVFGLIEFFSGRLFHRGLEGRFNAQSYQAFLEWVLAQTTEPLFLVQDGAKYHHAAALRPFWAAHRDRLFTVRLPSYSPDYNPIEFLWRATKRRATHNRYFPAFDALIGSVEAALAYFAAHPERVKVLFGRYLDEMAEAADAALPAAA